MGLIGKAKEKFNLNREKKEGDAPLSPTDTTTTPAFDSNKVMVIYVLGGPGAGTCISILDRRACIVNGLVRHF
jgi:hypothetical protein